MADQKFTDYYTILNCIRGCDTDLQNFKIRALQLHQLKQEILDDTERRDALKLLIDLDEEVTMQDLADKYAFYKAVYDLIVQQEA